MNTFDLINFFVRARIFFSACAFHLHLIDFNSAAVFLVLSSAFIVQISLPCSLF
jgi:hypothetical protein